MLHRRCDALQAAKDSEIAFLREQVKELQTKLASLADQGFAIREAQAKRIASFPTPAPREPTEKRMAVKTPAAFRRNPKYHDTAEKADIKMPMTARADAGQP